MKILLLQDKVYLPSYGGGNKATRMLLEALASKGHECVSISPALISRAGPSNEFEFQSEMLAREIVVEPLAIDVFRYHYRGVRVYATNFATARTHRDYIKEKIKKFGPDTILVSDDKDRVLLECAIGAAAQRTIPLLQTVIHLPFGPLSRQRSDHQTTLIRRASSVVVISKFMQEYLQKHGDISSQLIPMPVYGPGPFRFLGNFHRGHVTMINPCVEKGMNIFLMLAQKFKQVDFAAVPTWGADSSVLEALEKVPNIKILEPADNIEEILECTRILLVPSVWPETFGYVVPEAMLRGIPVIASNVGGLPEAKLGVDYVLPRVSSNEEPKNMGPWIKALDALLSNSTTYENCSKQSRQAALKFLSQVGVEPFEKLFQDVLHAATSNRPNLTNSAMLLKTR